MPLAVLKIIQPPGHGNDQGPVVGKQVLHMGRGKIGDGSLPFQRLLKPLALPHLGRGNPQAAAGAGVQAAVLPKDGDIYHIRAAALQNGQPLAQGLRPLVRLGGCLGGGEVQGGYHVVDVNFQRGHALQQGFLGALYGVLLQKLGDPGHQHGQHKQQNNADAGQKRRG